VIRRRASALLLAVVFVAAGCSATESEPPDTGSVVESLGPGDSIPDTGESQEPVSSEPESTSIPGFDGWLTLNPGAVDMGETISGFAMSLTKRALWSGTSRGVLFYTTIDGDFRLTGTVRATRTSDSSLDPGGDGTSQLAGLMARHEGSSESWVLLEVGGAETGLTLATGSTTNGQGNLMASPWHDNEADLKICRVGTTFTFWTRAADSGDDWMAVDQVARRDLGGTIQVGASLSADATPDLTGFFDGLTLEPMDPGEDC
jgi:hypothetical protein